MKVFLDEFFFFAIWMKVFLTQAASRMPGTWANCALNMSCSLGAPLPNACCALNMSYSLWCHDGLSPKSVNSLMMGCTIALQWALHHCLLSIFLPLHSPLVAQIPQLTDGAPLLQTTPTLLDSPDGP